jgi:hypothetical protein
LPHPEQSLPVGVQAALLGSDGAVSVGHALVHEAQVPPLHEVSPAQVPQMPPQPSEPQVFPAQFGVQMA